jgi:hypothetical protein
MADYLKVSAIKKMIKASDHRCSMDFINALDKKVEEIIKTAISESKAITLKELI